MSHRKRSTKHTLHQILEEEQEIERDERAVLHELRLHYVHEFHPIKEISMVPLAAGQTATFATTAIPAGAAPDPSKIVWTSSDNDNAPVVSNPNDPSGLSATVSFPSTTPEGKTFILVINYTNPDGKFVSKSNSFTTVAAPPSDITDFTDIVQTQ